MTGRLQSKVCIITGAGPGIGLAVARRYAAEGATLILNDLLPEAAERTAEAVRAVGGQVETRPGDVTDSGFMNSLVDGVAKDYGRLDVMHNNAGGSRAKNLIADLTDDEWRRTLELNLTAAFYGVRAALRVMVPQRFGSIICTTSLAGLGGSIGFGGLGPAKAGVVQLARDAAAEAGFAGVRTNCIAPGAIGAPPFLAWVDSQTGGREAYSEHIPQRRIGDPDEVAKVAVFLASDDSSYVNGAVITVDGGAFSRLASPVISRPELTPPQVRR